MALQAWNTQTGTDLNLSGPTGQVYALVVGNEMLFAGIQVYFSFSVAFSQFAYRVCSVINNQKVCG